MSEPTELARAFVDEIEREDDKPWDEDFKYALAISYDTFATQIAAERAKPAASDRLIPQEIEDILLGHMDRRTEETLNRRIAAALAEARREGYDAAYARYAQDHKDLVRVMYEEREAKVAEARREGGIAMRERATETASAWAKKSAGAIRLAGGEMSAQEVRNVHAFAAVIAGEISRLPDNT